MKLIATRFLNVTLAVTALQAGSQAYAATVINPGQCVIIQGTQVCAALPTPEQCNQVATTEKADHIYTCRYGSHPHSETPGLKSYALFRTTLTKDGRKVDMLIKDYGITDKAACEKDAEARN